MSLPLNSVPIVLESASPVLVTVKVCGPAVLPLAVSPKECDVGAIVRLAGVIPVPARSAEAVPPGAPVACSVSALAPVVVGAKARSTVQEAPDASAWPLHVVVPAENWPVSPLTPVVTAPESTPPVLVTVKVWEALVVPVAWSPKSRAAGVISSAAGLAAVPVRPVTVEPPGAPLTTTDAVLAPTVVGAKATSTVQLSPAPRVVPLQASALVANCAAAPVTATSRLPVATSPPFVTVSVSGAELVPVAAMPKPWSAGVISSDCWPTTVSDVRTRFGLHRFGFFFGVRQATIS